jgi:hypothetical protein
LFSAVVKVFDNSIIEGHRSKEDQNQRFNYGSSKLRGGDPRAKHCHTPSLAVDAYPYSRQYGLITGAPQQTLKIIDKTGKSQKDVERYIWGQFFELRGVVMAVAHQMEIEVINGLDWDRDGDTLDHTFLDAMHYELVG